LSPAAWKRSRGPGGAGASRYADLSRRYFLKGALGAASWIAFPHRLVAAPPPIAASAAGSPDRYPAIIPRFPHILHGGDWNPDQWLGEPAVIEEDFRLMEEAGCNTFSVGIFAWSHLEPEEGRFEFGWLDRVMDGLAARGFNAFLATPSGAKPRWMSEKYPEVRRVDAEGRREPHGHRHNHCFSSPVYREKVGIINAKLAQRYASHRALALWHISNEYNGACYCDYCLEAFRTWLKGRYASLDALNRAWWSSFWSQTYQSWEQIDPRATPLDGLLLDWDRFVTHQTVDFMRHEVSPLKAAAPHVPVTTNMMGTFMGLDYARFTGVCDRMAWDAYPTLHGDESWRQVPGLSFIHDLYRSLKGGLPFILMESTPSSTNWFQTPVLKPPGQHRQEMLLAIGHGADTAMYFQWRKGRGGYEKFHGAVVDHEGSDRTRVFQDVAGVGALLHKLDDVVGTTVRPEVAVIHDWEVRWALSHSQGPRRSRDGAGRFDKEYVTTAVDHYRPFWKLGVPVDVVESLASFDRYRLLVAPMLFLLKPGVGERLKAFVSGGGTLLLTYHSGVVNENNLVWRGGGPGGGLRELAGVWAEEIDALYPNPPQRIVPVAGNPLGLAGEHPVREYCERIHPEGARVLAGYKTDFYAGEPCLTVNRIGAGRVYYLAARPAEEAFHDALAGTLLRELGVARCLDVLLPEGVSVQKRVGGGRTFLFLHNFKPSPQSLDLGAARLRDLSDGRLLTGPLTLPAHGSLVGEPA
jgi:beta-galactosidase